MNEPESGEVADAMDLADWNNDFHGRMAEYATDDDTVKTVLYEED
ncbi:hypothetical protein [Kocuria flava]|nr:hypothetical protein [Kocuria flava]